MTDPDHQPGRTAFIIGPIGDEGSDVRDHADTLYEYIILPVLRDELGFESVDRSDLQTSPGLITNQLIVSILEADLVIADLSFDNPNALYELGLAHSYKIRTVHMAQRGHQLPFDQKDYRTVFFGMNNPQQHKDARNRLADQVRAALNDDEVRNPVATAIGLRDASQAGDDQSQLIATLFNEIEALTNRVDYLGIPEQRRFINERYTDELASESFPDTAQRDKWESSFWNDPRRGIHAAGLKPPGISRDHPTKHRPPDRPTPPKK